jgi:hypothetical protein
MRKAAVNYKKGGAGKKTLKDYVYSGLQVDPYDIPVTPPKWVIDARPVKVGQARVIRWRPRFDTWELTFTITILDPEVWDPRTVREIMDGAGKYIGLCDNRPLNGLFEVTKWENV